MLDAGPTSTPIGPCCKFSLSYQDDSKFFFYTHSSILQQPDEMGPISSSLAFKEKNSFMFSYHHHNHPRRFVWAFFDETLIGFLHYTAVANSAHAYILRVVCVS